MRARHPVGELLPQFLLVCRAVRAGRRVDSSPEAQLADDVRRAFAERLCQQRAPAASALLVVHEFTRDDGWHQLVVVEDGVVQGWQRRHHRGVGNAGAHRGSGRVG